MKNKKVKNPLKYCKKYLLAKQNLFQNRIIYYVREMLIIYITDDKYNEFPGIKTIKDDLKKMRQKKEPEKYI